MHVDPVLKMGISRRQQYAALFFFSSIVAGHVYLDHLRQKVRHKVQPHPSSEGCAIPEENYVTPLHPISRTMRNPEATAIEVKTVEKIDKEG